MLLVFSLIASETNYILLLVGNLWSTGKCFFPDGRIYPRVVHTYSILQYSCCFSNVFVVMTWIHHANPSQEMT